MTEHQIVEAMEQILSQVKTGVLATVNKEGYPEARWMTPVFLQEEPRCIYAVTSIHFNKIHDVAANPNASWMIQTRELNKIVNARGKINIIDNPELKSRVFETLSRRPTVLWKIASDPSDLIVLETVIEQAVYFQPTAGTKETVDFGPRQ
ncbi:MAG: pyridoxamine 5'-phosphate oxidase family protein [Chitinispirillaceae bacterium]|nr:pyridoxamine 5'-phosphate oxidase family protein [Chitinispirillaceae bacterium]